MLHCSTNSQPQWIPACPVSPGKTSRIHPFGWFPGSDHIQLMKNGLSCMATRWPMVGIRLYWNPTSSRELLFRRKIAVSRRGHAFPSQAWASVLWFSYRNCPELHALPCSMSVAPVQSSSSKTWSPSPPSWGSGSRAGSVWELDKRLWMPWREVELGLDPASRSECFWFYRQDNTIRRKHLFDSQGCHHQSDPCKSKHQSSLHSWGL